jgi:hypothetical protein
MNYTGSRGTKEFFSDHPAPGRHLELFISRIAGFRCKRSIPQSNATQLGI